MSILIWLYFKIAIKFVIVGFFKRFYGARHISNESKLLCQITVHELFHVKKKVRGQWFGTIGILETLRASWYPLEKPHLISLLQTFFMITYVFIWMKYLCHLLIKNSICTLYSPHFIRIWLIPISLRFSIDGSLSNF